MDPSYIMRGKYYYWEEQLNAGLSELFARRFIDVKLHVNTHDTSTSECTHPAGHMKTYITFGLNDSKRALGV